MLNIVGKLKKIEYVSMKWDHNSIIWTRDIEESNNHNLLLWVLVAYKPLCPLLFTDLLETVD